MKFQITHKIIYVVRMNGFGFYSALFMRDLYKPVRISVSAGLFEGEADEDTNAQEGNKEIHEAEDKEDHSEEEDEDDDKDNDEEEREAEDEDVDHDDDDAVNEEEKRQRSAW